MPVFSGGVRVVGAVFLFGCSVLLTSCSGDSIEPDQETSMTSYETHEGGGISVSEGYTQEEQLAEVAFVLEVMREYFGDVQIKDVEGDADIEAYREQVSPRPCTGDYYRYRVGFEIEERDHQELYDRAEAVAAELGLSENRNNSRGPDGDPMLYGAGLAEDRLFQVNTVTGKLSVFYRGRCSDHETMQKVVQDFGDQRLEELEENAPTHLPGYGE